jgi:hypothetical protein
MKHLLSSTAFIVLNKELARQVGLKEAVLLADLISKEEYFIANGMTDGWFFNTAKNIEDDTCLTSHQQRKAIKSLKDLGIIETKLVGIPAKQHFKIIENKLLSYFNPQLLKKRKLIIKKAQTSCEESEQLAVKKTQTINKNNNKNNNNNNISIRELNFINQVSLLDYDLNLKKEFCDYWTEPNKSNTKMKFELNKTWQTELRLKTWAANQKKWDKPKSSGMSKIHQHLQKNINVKEKLLKQFKK